MLKVRLVVKAIPICICVVRILWTDCTRIQSEFSACRTRRTLT